MNPFSNWQGTTARGEAQSSLRKAMSLEDQLIELERRVEQQAIIMQAFATILTDRLGMTEPELLKVVQQMQVNRPSARERKCSKCDNFLPSRKNKCIYCGHDEPVNSVTEKL